MMGRPEDERVARNMIARCSEAIIPHSLATETAVSRLSPRGEEGGEREGRWRGREGRNIQDTISRHHTEGRQALTSDHDSAEGCRGEGGDDRGRLWLQTILHHNQTLKHQVTLHHITERGGGEGERWRE